MCSKRDFLLFVQKQWKYKSLYLPWIDLVAHICITFAIAYLAMMELKEDISSQAALATSPLLKNGAQYFALHFDIDTAMYQKTSECILSNIVIIL